MKKIPFRKKSASEPTGDSGELLWGMPEWVASERGRLETLVRAPQLLGDAGFRRRLRLLGEEWLQAPDGLAGCGVRFSTLSSVMPDVSIADGSVVGRRGSMEPDLRIGEAVPVALEAIAWARLLPMLRDTVRDPADGTGSDERCGGNSGDGDEWTFMEAMLTGVADDAAALTIADHGLLYLYLAGELPLTMAVMFESHPDRVALWNAARRNVNVFCDEIFDGEGIPASEYFDAHRMMLASLLRCRRLVTQVGGMPGWRRRVAAFRTESTQANHEWLIRHAIRWSRIGGGQNFIGASVGDDRDFWRQLLVEDGDDDDQELANLCLPVVREPGWKATAQAFPLAACHSEWAGVTTLRSDWSADSPRLTVLYESELARTNPSNEVAWVVVRDDADDSDNDDDGSAIGESGTGSGMRLELESQVVLLTGSLDVELIRDGERSSRRMVSGWKENVYFSDENGDYLELGCELEGGVRMERQFFLGRDERFLMIADCVIDDGVDYAGKRSGAAPGWVYRCVLPCPMSVDWVPTTGTPAVPGVSDACGGYLLAARRGAAPRPWAMVMPLTVMNETASMNEKPLSVSAAVTDGSMRRVAAGLELTWRVTGTAFWVPIWIHLDPAADTAAKEMPGALASEFGWRRLTVGEERAAVSESIAAGYRVRFGERQWLLYRALRECGNRSVLGHNLTSEFLLARFDPKEGVQPLVEIE